MEGEKTMTSRERILSKLKSNSEKLLNSANENEGFEFPDLSALKAITYDDPVKKFIESAQNVSGAKVIEFKPGDDFNEIIRIVYPDAKVISSNLSAIQADMNPDQVKSPSDLMHADVGVVKGYIGVAENGCIWIPQTMKERAILFASEYLVIILSVQNIVNNMHEAYKIIDETPAFFDKNKFATFISGPSKTADIESALVYGAQAARGVTVILT